MNAMEEVQAFTRLQCKGSSISKAEVTEVERKPITLNFAGTIKILKNFSLMGNLGSV